MHTIHFQHGQPGTQGGIAIVIVTAAMLALLAAGALAFDVGNTTLHKTRLQNAVDAAALAGATVLHKTHNITDSTAGAREAFLLNASANGNQALQQFYDSGGLIEVQYSATLHPFSPGTTPEEYVRVRVANMPLQVYFASLVGITDSAVSASAVAGPSPGFGPDASACNIAPMMVCGDPSDPEGTHFGYTYGDVQVLKTSAGNGANWEVGTGNFQLIRLDEGQGGAEVRENMAGRYDACHNGDADIETEPGNTIGPVAQGLNTRFGQYLGPMNQKKDDYPPDVVTTENTVEIQFDENGDVTTLPDELDFNYSDYTDRVQDKLYDHTPPPEGRGRFDRRLMALPIGDCSETINGQGTVSLLGYGCFFVLQKVSQQGNEAEIYGQFVENCHIGGAPGSTPGTEGPYIIQLYEDPTSSDS